MLGFVGMAPNKDQDSIDYRTRAPIVVPPRTDLPPPVEAVRNPAWPKDTDVEEERRAALGSRRPAPQTTPNAPGVAAGTELREGSGALPPDGPPDECQSGGTMAICLSTPMKVVKSIMSGFHQEDVALGPEPQRKYLTEPPPGFRKPTGTGIAKANIETPKDKTGPGNYFTSQLPKSPAPN